MNKKKKKEELTKRIEKNLKKVDKLTQNQLGGFGL